LTTWSRPASFVLACVLAGTGVVVALAAATPAAAVPASGTYHATIPTRILDTRIGLGSAAVPVPPGGEVVLQVADLPPVPANASAVVLNVTVTEPKAAGFVTVYPDGSGRPNASNLNFVANQTVPALVVVAVPSNGKVRFYNQSPHGSVQLFADVSGYYTGADAPSGQGAFGVLPPWRLLDTRVGLGAPKGAVAARSSVSFPVTGHGVPLGVSAVVLNVTATEPTTGGFITAYPHGGPIPTASNLNFLANQTVPNLVVVPVGGDGSVSLFNGSVGTVHLLADISGYFEAGDPVTAGTLGALVPVRLLDTRGGVPPTALAPHGSRTLVVRGRGGVPLAGTGAVILNVTVTSSTAGGYLTVYGAADRPGVSNLNFSKGQIVPNLVVTQVSASGTVTFYNGSTGSVHVLADVSGYIPNADAPLPTTSTSRYLRNITGVTADVQTMQDEGCLDSRAGSTFVLLDIGAQSKATALLADGTSLGPANPGVRLTNSEVRLSYPQLRNAVDAYTLGFTTCGLGNVTVAVGTNNSGVSSTYPASVKGADWASEVVDKLTMRPHVTLSGANDIEASFGDTQANALAWETNYLSATSLNLVYSGSADNCPVTFGSSLDCGAVGGQVGPNWTRANYAYLAHGLSPSRITALPQIYYASQAVQWANINTTAMAAGSAIVFAGALTEKASACGADCAMTPGQGWAALFHSISTTVTTPSIPVVTDLRVDS
jgi:hypothetical protein